MRHSLLIIATASALAGCGTTTPQTDARRGIDPVHVPVVTRQDFVFDAAAPGGQLGPSEAARLDGWFQGLDLTYGDSIYVEGPAGPEARSDVARVAGRYGMMVSDGAPVVAGAMPSGGVRIVVTRARASVPGCPDWSIPSQPNYSNRSMPNLGCGVNANIAAMVANPEDLLHGREAAAAVDVQTASKAVESYRATKPTGEGGLKDISTKKGGN